MSILKRVGNMAVGAALATIIIFGVYHNARIKRLEITQSQIVQALTQPKQVQQKAE